MRVLEHLNGDNFVIKTDIRDLTHRICTYGEVNSFWKVMSSITYYEGVFSVEVLLLDDVSKICSHLSLKLE